LAKSEQINFTENCYTCYHKEEEESSLACKWKTGIESIYGELSARKWRQGEQITFETEDGKAQKEER
jgi:hypothetical protein